MGRSLLSGFIIWTRPIELGRIDLLVIVSRGPIQPFVCRELIPGTVTARPVLIQGEVTETRRLVPFSTPGLQLLLTLLSPDSCDGGIRLERITFARAGFQADVVRLQLQEVTREDDERGLDRGLSITKELGLPEGETELSLGGSSGENSLVSKTSFYGDDDILSLLETRISSQATCIGCLQYVGLLTIRAKRRRESDSFVEVVREFLWVRGSL